jgi:hypothetical protein
MSRSRSAPTVRRVAVGLAAAAVALLGLGAARAPAATPIADYKAGGEARGVDIGFTFQKSVFARLVDLGLPWSRTDLSSEAGGAARGEAAQLFPSDLVIGAVGEAFPGYRRAVYPATEDDPKPVDEGGVTDSFGPLAAAGRIAAGPLGIDTGRVRVTASADEASGLATTNRIVLGTSFPQLAIESLQSFTESRRAADHVEHVARTTARNIRIAVSKDLVVSVRELVSEALTRSDGQQPAAERHLTVSGVQVRMGGTTYEAAIDENGIRLVGAPPGLPGAIPQKLTQTLNIALEQAQVQITLAGGSATVEDVGADASVGGLVIRLLGVVPSIFVPEAVTRIQQTVVEIIESQEILPDLVRQLFSRSICYVDDVKPILPKQLADNLPDLPLCVSPQLIPGPGSGIETSIAIGAVRSSSAAVQEISFEEPPTNGGGSDGGGTGGPGLGPGPGGLGDLGGSGSNGFFGGGGGTASGPGTGGPRVLYGLVARLPSSALLGAGGGLLALSLALAAGPSLRPMTRRAS